jgi:uncharacterized membrane protein
MMTCLDHPSQRRAAARPEETEIIFPFRNAGLRLQPLNTTADSSGVVFSFRALASRRLQTSHVIELTTYCHAPLENVYAHWTKCAHLPHFMRAVGGACGAESPAHLWKLRLRDEEVSWDAVTIERLPCQRISWWSTGSSSHRNRGCVSFKAMGRRSTKVVLHLEFYESHAWAVTETTVRTLGAALDAGLDRLHASMTGGPMLGPGVASL